MAKTRIDKNQCIGCGVCTAVAASVYAFTDDGLAEAIVEVVPDDALDAVKEAADSCPVQAIIVE